MANLGQLRAAISGQLGLDNKVAGDQNQIDGWIDEARIDVLLRTRVNVVPGSMTLIPGKFDYTLSTDILALEELYASSTGNDYTMERKSPSEIMRMRIGTSWTGTPPIRYYALNGGSLLMFYPTPDAADTIHFYYVPRPVTMREEFETPDEIPAEYHKLLEFYGCWRAGQWSDNGSSQNGKSWHDLYELELRQMRGTVLNRGGRKLSRAVVGRRNRLVGTPSQQDV